MCIGIHDWKNIMIQYIKIMNILIIGKMHIVRAENYLKMLANGQGQQFSTSV